MVTRAIRKLLLDRLSAYPAVLLSGPRQSGKTTLARSLSSLYFDLEQPPDTLRLDFQWEELTAGNRLIVLDEAQNQPDLFPRLRGTIDADRRRNGRFLLLGSVSPALMRHVSESLAGRLAITQLTPLLSVELPASKADLLWLRGGFPDGGILKPARFPQWQRDYLDLLIQRDLPSWGLPAKPAVTRRLLHMIAAMHGQNWNASQIGQSLGLTYHTINSYLDYLEGAFLTRRLPPWLPNLRKRLIRSPRVYWRDSGLMHALLGVHDKNDLLRQPWVGASWEGFVIQQILGLADARGWRIEPHYFRSVDGLEADLVFQSGSALWAIEIKLTASPSPQDFDRLNRAADLLGASRRFLITRTSQPIDSPKGGVVNLPVFLRLLEKACE